MWAHMKAFVYTRLYLFHQHLMKTHYVSDTVKGMEYINSERKLEQIITKSRCLPIDHRNIINV